MTLTEFQELWLEDSKIHQNNPHRFLEQMGEIDQLRSKYWNILNEEKRRQRKLETNRLTLLVWLEGYYKDGIYLTELKRRPHDIIPKNKEDRDRLIATDELMVKLDQQRIDSDQMALMCQDIIKGLKERSYAFKNIADYKRFLNGEV